MIDSFGPLLLLLIAFSNGVDALAIRSNVSSLPTPSAFSVNISSPLNDTASPTECNDIHNCRTISGIIQSCIVTTLACVWFAVHQNIPAPQPKRPPINAGQFIWYKLLDQRQSAIIFFVTLFFPEWVLTWALRQLLRARELVKELEAARKEAESSWEMEQKESEEEDGEDGEEEDEMSDSEETDHRAIASISEVESDEQVLIKRRSAAPGHDSQLALAMRIGNASEPWTLAHAFFVIMGGFLFANEKGPVHTLDPSAVVRLVREGRLVPPTAAELSNESKGDALSKGIAILQTLWFVMQCIARRIEHLPITRLEVMTILYTIVAAAMYITFWAKPLNVAYAIRVTEDAQADKADEYISVWHRMATLASGDMDDYVDLSRCTRVPTFWAGRPTSRDMVIASVLTWPVTIAIVALESTVSEYGYDFQLQFEDTLWLWSNIAIVSVGGAIIVLAFVAPLIGKLFSDSDKVAMRITGTSFIPLCIIYICSRLCLHILSFAELASLPFSAYQTIQWTTFIPHL